MKKPELTIEELLNDTEFIDYCLTESQGIPDKWRQQLLHYPQNEKTFEKAKSYMRLLEGKMSEELIEAKQLNFIALFRKVQQEKLEQEQRTKVKTSQPLLWIGIAASLLLVLSTAIFLFKAKSKLVSTYENLAGKSIESGRRSQKSITLADGTEAIIYPGAKLVISDDYNDDFREVAVYGQVFFKIFPQKDKPFIAYSKHTTTTALGTAFYVRDFKNTAQSTVILVNGNVKVQAPGSKQVGFLEPGTMMLVSNKTGAAEKRTVSKQELTELLEQKLNFNDSNTINVIDKLEIYYGAEIDISRCHGELKKITGDYSGQSLSNILSSIAYINHLSWRIDEEQHIIFEPLP
ncbi:ferric-dicitrate binding protein FerR, regulates iron transport through sigma-19 [Pedobacter steynii]|uniref:Ferric-dicitrate binding protein FerR, regulates iron transport through sigma-19 n=1 Tax=Pedobacter steynii TaxID=430522 RepID=A0A1G9NSS0_9SPHI|nr:FecR family protein [Pedobacter steynii]NQX39212.1 FecR family protein [Pedobacter steynii]SDL89035.1 ferric-dicitrate binding protein FerR, regulates iron transport through sigma-19 [Pedobacter steynii]